LNFTF